MSLRRYQHCQSEKSIGRNTNHNTTKATPLDNTVRKQPVTAMFEPSPWHPGPSLEEPARTVLADITHEHIQQARWDRFHDPI